MTWMRQFRLRNGQIHGAPQLRCVGFIGIGGGGTEGCNVELPTAKAPGPEFGIAHRMGMANGAPELRLGREEKFSQRRRQIVAL